MLTGVIQPDPNTVIISNFLSVPGPVKNLDALGCLSIHPVFGNTIFPPLDLRITWFSDAII